MLCSVCEVVCVCVGLVWCVAGRAGVTAYFIADNSGSFRVGVNKDGVHNTLTPLPPPAAAQASFSGRWCPLLSSASYGSPALHQAAPSGPGHTHTHVLTHTFICIHTHIYIYTHKQIYKHTHTQTNKNNNRVWVTMETL